MSYTIEIPDAVEDALAADTFDVLDFIAGAALPTDEVVVFTDKAAAHRLNRLLEEEAANKSEEADSYSLADYDKSSEHEEEITELYAQLNASALTFELKGLAPALVEAIEKEKTAKHNHRADDLEDIEYFNDYYYTLVAKTVTGVRRGDGATNKNPWTVEQVEKLMSTEGLHATQQGVLLNAVIVLNFNSKLFENAVTPDFS